MRLAIRIIGILVLITLFLLPIALFFMGRQKIATPPTPAPASSATQQIPSVIKDTSFTSTGYIQPLGKQTETNKYSDRAYVRGIVTKWTSKELTVQVATKPQVIQLPKEVQLRCFDEYITNNKGEKKKTSDVHLDVSRLDDPGVPTMVAEIATKIPAGKDIIVIVDVGSSERMTAHQIFGFGCKEML